MQLITTLTQKGQVVIPKILRDQFLLKPFDKVAFQVANDQIVLKPVPTTKQMMGFIKADKHFTQADFDKVIEESFGQDSL